MNDKYLKFISSLTDEHVSDIKDICLELRDNGFQTRNFMSSKGFNLEITKNKNNFNFNETHDVILRLCDYSQMFNIDIKIMAEDKSPWPSGFKIHNDITNYYKFKFPKIGTTKKIKIYFK